MSQHLVLSFIGDDKPGLVERLSATVVEHQGNWLESKMSHLANKFAGILVVSVPLEQKDALIYALQDDEKLGLHIRVESGDVVETDNTLVSLSVVGNDRPGIVREVSQVLHSLMVNVTSLSTDCEPAAMSSEMLFKTDMELSVPSDVSLEALELALEKISSDLMVEWPKD